MKSKKKKKNLHQKIPDNSANKCFKRPRAPFNYSRGIQQFPVLSPRGIVLNLHGGVPSRKQKTTSNIFAARTYRDRKEQEEETFVLFLPRPFKLRIWRYPLRPRFGKVVFRATQHNTLSSWPCEINGPIYELPMERERESSLNKISAMPIHFPRAFKHPPVQRGYHSRWLLGIGSGSTNIQCCLILILFTTRILANFERFTATVVTESNERSLYQTDIYHEKNIT